ncbi:hypothetical protein GCM10023334_084700 [Nonomuraea thailandensis]
MEAITKRKFAQAAGPFATPDRSIKVSCPVAREPVALSVRPADPRAAVAAGRARHDSRDRPVSSGE